MARNLTTVLIEYRKNRINHRLLFGEPVLTIRRGWRRKLAAFEAGKIFGYERWHANHYGTQDWRIAVCLTVKAGSVTKFPGIIPGAIILLDTSGKTRVKRVLAMLDALKRTSDKSLADIASHEWREHANGIEIGENLSVERLLP